MEDLLKQAAKSERQNIQQELLSRLLHQGTIPSSASDAELVRIATFSDEAALASDALSRITSEDARATLACKHSIARIRLAAAETLSSEAVLQSVMQTAQGSDKAVYRLCKDRLAARHQAEAEQAALQQKAEQLKDQLQHLLSHSDSPDFTGRYQILSKRWDDLKTRVTDIDSTAITALLEEAAHIEQQRRDAEAKEAAAHLAFQEREQIIERLEAALQDAGQPSGSWSSLLDAEQQAWQSACAEFPASEAETARVTRLLDQAGRVLVALREWETASREMAAAEADQAGNAGLIARINWPEKVAAPQWLLELMSTDNEDSSVTDVVEPPQAPVKSDKDPETLQQINTLSAQMENALESGNASDAGKLEKRLQKLLTQLSPKARHKAQGSIRLLSGRLHELRDWQGFAVTPKKEVLCSEMEALAVSAADDPESRADQIRALQQSWKDLGYSGNDRELWERFRAAADRAYEPCKAFYAEQEQQRQAMTAQRDELIAELTRYESGMDWDSADWKAVQTTLDVARNAFRELGPVDHKNHNRTQKAFRAVCDQIYAHLKAEYDRNLAQKKAIVEHAATAAGSDDVHAAADQIKQLQQQWKTVGVTPRAPDQRLWSELRQHADAVFSRLGEQRQARRQELDELVAQGEALVASAAQAVNDSADNAAQLLNEAASGLNALDLPKSAAERLNADVTRLQKQLRDAQSEKQRAATMASWDALLTLLKTSDQLPDTLPPLPEGIETGWLTHPQTSELSSAEICIRMEILADRESPASDQEARMGIQVKRLAEGMGRGMNLEQERANLIRDWFACSENDAEVTLRFCEALEASL